MLFMPHKKPLLLLGASLLAACSSVPVEEQNEELRLLLGEIRAREQVLDKRQKLLENRGRLLASLELQQENVAVEADVEDVVSVGGDFLTAPQATEGQCFLLAALPPRLSAEPQTVVVQDAADQVVVTPPEFVYDTRELVVDYEYLTPDAPPVAMVSKEVSLEVRPAYNSWEPVPASFTSRMEPLLSVAAHQTFEACDGEPQPARLSQQWCAKSVAAEYQQVERRAVAELSSARQITVPAERISVAVKEPKDPAQKENMRPVLRQIAQARLQVPASYRREVQLPEFKTVTVKQLTRPASLSWREVVCADALNTALIKTLQKALNERGYEAGEADGAWGGKTEQALTQFRKDKLLPELGRALSLNLLKQLEIPSPSAP